MSLTPNEAPRSGQRTPGAIATELSKLEFPPPTNLHLQGPGGPTSPRDGSDLSAQLSKMALPEPEALSKAKSHRRSESQSQDLAEQLSRMNLPQPEHIYGPDDTRSSGKQGVSAEDWAKVKLEDEVPEAVKSPTEMHVRRNSRAASISAQRPPAAAPKAPASPTKAAPAAAKGAAKEQKITPFDVQGGVDEEGKEIGM